HCTLGADSLRDCAGQHARQCSGVPCPQPLRNGALQNLCHGFHFELADLALDFFFAGGGAGSTGAVAPSTLFTRSRCMPKLPSKMVISPPLMTWSRSELMVPLVSLTSTC